MAGIVSPERKALQTKANIFVVIALLLDFGGYGAAKVTHIPLFARGAAVIGLVFWVVGLMAYAESKGYSKWWGLIGLLSCCGLFILVLLPNKWIDASTGGYGSGDYPRPNG